MGGSVAVEVGLTGNGKGVSVGGSAVSVGGGVLLGVEVGMT